MNYENEFIKVVRLDDSNRHNRMCYSKLDKMWSIICVEKKPFYNLTNFKEFKNEFNAYISSVSTGVNRGCVGIRIPDMKQCPTVQIAKTILDFIFEKSKRRLI